MRRRGEDGPRHRGKGTPPMKLAARAFLIAAMLAAASGATAQDRERYILGETTRLEILVHVMGQVQTPGEYRVPDKTNVLELISKAGGPTDFARLSGVIVKRGGGTSSAESSKGEVIHVNLESYLTRENAKPVPILQPGDVVTVPSNSWSTWKAIFGIARDVSVVASLYLLWVRTANRAP
ncbi:MAG: polysaccharide biosynthesis/export family protein [bacterium]